MIWASKKAITQVRAIVFYPPNFVQGYPPISVQGCPPDFG
jgi:hypothetical protein